MEQPPPQGFQEGPLGGHLEPGRRVFDGLQDVQHPAVVGPHLDGQGALTGRRHETLGGEVIGDPVLHAQAGQPGGCQHRPVGFVTLRLA